MIHALICRWIPLLAILAFAGCSDPDETRISEPVSPFDSASVLQSPVSRGALGAESPTSTDLEALLSGETLARYRALPPAYRQALQVYTHVGVSSGLISDVVKDKMDQWGAAVIPLSELVGSDHASRFQRTEPRPPEYASLLGTYYVFLLNTEPDEQRRARAMRELVDVMASSPQPDTIGLDSDEASDPDRPPPPMMEWPDLETFLTPTALARLDELAPRLQHQLREPINVDDTGQNNPSLLKDVVIFMPRYEVFLLKAQSSLELPLLEDVLTGEDRAVFQSLPRDARERTARSFRNTVRDSYITAAFQPDGASTVSPWDEETLAEIAASHLELLLTISESSSAGTDI